MILSHNQAIGDPAVTVGSGPGFSGGARGGGVYNNGTLDVVTCQFLDNLAHGASGKPELPLSGFVAGFGGGGGIANDIAGSGHHQL